MNSGNRIKTNRLKRCRLGEALFVICGLLVTSLFANGVQAYEFCKSEHSHRVIGLWDGYPEWYGSRDGVEVELVKSVQRALRDYDSKTNYIRDPIGHPDGYFGYATETAVRQLQLVEAAAGSVDGRVGGSVRSVLCNLGTYLENCRATNSNALSVYRMNGCGVIHFFLPRGYVYQPDRSRPCRITLQWYSGNGGSKTVDVYDDQNSVTLATGVRRGALFGVTRLDNCEIGGDNSSGFFYYGQ